MITVDVFWGLFYIVDKIGVIMPFVMHLVVVPVVVGGGVVGSGERFALSQRGSCRFISWIIKYIRRSKK